MNELYSITTTVLESGESRYQEISWIIFKNRLVPIKTLDVDSVDNFTLCPVEVVKNKNNNIN